MGDNAEALADAAAELEDAAEQVSDAAGEVVDAPATATDEIDTTPIADAIGDAADDVTHLDHEGRLAALETRLAGLAPGATVAAADHMHFDLAAADHSHVDLTPPEEIPVPPAPADTEPENDESTEDEAPSRTHPLLARPFARG
jgi:hypothetical protein